jgi:hypothetical protein
LFLSRTSEVDEAKVIKMDADDMQKRKLMAVLDVLSKRLFESEDIVHMEEETLEALLGIQAGRRVKRPRMREPRDTHHAIWKLETSSDGWMRGRLNMDKKSFDCIHALLSQGESFKQVEGKQRQHDSRLVIAAFLFHLVTGVSIKKAAEAWEISEGTLHRHFDSLLSSLCDMKDDLISFPKTDQDRDRISKGFFDKYGIPGVLGAIDGTHIPIENPDPLSPAYFNRKGFASLQVQGVVDSELRFVNVHAGIPGSAHDTRVFRNSVFGDISRVLPVQLHSKFHLIGDNGYPLRKYLIVPFNKNETTDEYPGRLSFNMKLSAARCTIERAWAKLKNRFRILYKQLPYKEVSKMVKVIIACIVLHNICVDLEDGTDIGEIEDTQAEDINPDLPEVSGRNVAATRDDYYVPEFKATNSTLVRNKLLALGRTKRESLQAQIVGYE